MSRKTMLVLFVLGFVMVFLLGWVLLYPSPDPKNITYVLWRAGFHTMDPAAAAGILVGDVHPERIVLGKTKEQLRSRFGYLTTLAEASRTCKVAIRLRTGEGRKCSSSERANG